MWTLPLTRSGIAPIDERLGGLTPGRAHLLTGSPGSGKSAFCLAFLATAFAEGTRAALLTPDEPADVLAHASDLGIDLPRAAAEGHFVMVRYARDFDRRFGRAASVEPAVDELVRMFGTGTLDRLVVDSVMPLVDGGSAAGSGIAALVHLLDRVRRTTLVTHPGDVRERYDLRLDPLVRRCSTVLHLSAGGDGIGRMELVKARARVWSEAPSFFRVEPGRGVVAIDGGARTASAHTRADFAVYDAAPAGRRALLIQGTEAVPADLQGAIAAAFPLTIQEGATTILPSALTRDVGIVVVVARWHGIADASTWLWRLRGSGNRTPAILVARDHFRSSDRARALLAGYDDVVDESASADELIVRITAAMRRGRSVSTPLANAVEARDDSSRGDASDAVLYEVPFRDEVEAAARRDRPFSVLFMNPGKEELGALVPLAARTVRGAQGDRVAVVGKRVAILLPDTRRPEATAVMRRLGDEWVRTGREPLRVALRALPADREQLRIDLRPASTRAGRVTT
jgi:KaiC/GvpD/RAD55 family RecA-like ATPase/DNA-binding NarL/FixJ family response regulator